jgi:serine/threonine-protein kinase
VHRDVSPHNVFLTFDGQVKLLDFGIAKGLISRARTSTDVIKGKIRYMAPEQMCGEAVDRRADIFSAGVILWEIATSRRIWHGRSEVNVMHAVLNEGVPSPSSVEPTVAPELSDICMRALQRNPNDRYQTAVDFQSALEGYLERMGSRVSQKEIGKFLAKAFADTRARTREVIEAELKKSDETAETSSGRFAFPQTLVSLANSTESGSVEPVVAPHSPRRGWAALGAALGVGVIVAGVLIFHRPSQTAGASQPTASTATEALPTAIVSAAPSVDPAASASAAALTHTVQVQLATTPPGAALFLDGKRIDNPYAGTYPVDPTRHFVRAEASGYVSATTDIVLDRDVKLVLPLVQAKTAVNPRHVPATTTPATPQTPAVTPSPAPQTPGNCTPPFYFDAQGIKRLKPECL